MQLNKEQSGIFKNTLLANTRDDLPLAAELETGKLYRMAKFRYVSRGYEDLRFFLQQNGEGDLYLDYYFATDDCISHARIDHTGAVTLLENLEGQWGRPVLETEEATQREHERIKAHNEKVRVILEQKGLAGTDEYRKPLFEMSATLIGSEWFTETKERIE